MHCRQQVLLRQLRIRFGEVPEDTAEAANATRDRDRLDTWLDRLMVVNRLDDLNIALPPRRTASRQAGKRSGPISASCYG